jgi:hypothetical protein
VVEHAEDPETQWLRGERQPNPFHGGTGRRTPDTLKVERVGPPLRTTPIAFARPSKPSPLRCPDHSAAAGRAGAALPGNRSLGPRGDRSGVRRIVPDAVPLTTRIVYGRAAMDPTLEQILLGLLTNGVTSVLEKSFDDATPDEFVSADVAVKAITFELAELEGLEEDVNGASLRAFLNGAEANALVRSLFVARIHDAPIATDELRAAFGRALLRTVSSATADHADRLFTILAKGAEATLLNAAATGDPAAEQAVLASHYRALADELAGLRSSLEELAVAEDSDIDEFLRWEQLYRAQVLVRHGTITPPSFDAVERVPIDDIYIESSFAAAGRPDEPTRLLRGLEVAAELNRTVVLGDPGAGKSTFSQKLVYDLAAERAYVPGGALTPFLVTLKDYGAEREESQISLVDWIERIANADYNAEAPAGAVRYLLSSGRAMVVFDGLDELLDTSYRQAVTADVETFAARYVATPILVTSRRVGYSQAPLDPRRFEILSLRELSDEQVGAYAARWFGLRRELVQSARDKMAEDFVRDSTEAADDLRRNPLMLALLCNIYRGDGYIPRRRPQVYEKCAVMLFERWDRGRRIVVALEFERHLRPAMQHLAFWIYSNPSLRGGVTERELIRSATEFLVGRRFEDEDAAREEAGKFVEFCRGRAWVFTDTGTASDGERLYQFTHRTFLEFFAAEHLVRTNRTPEDLGARLRPHIRAGEWDVVAQLAFQLQDDNLDGAADELLTDLLLIDDGATNDLVLSFAARSLAFLVPNRQTCRSVAQAVTRRTCEWLLAAKSDEPPSGSESVDETHRSLINCDRENFDPVAGALVDEALVFLGPGDDQQKAAVAVEVAANCDLAIRVPRDYEVRHAWDLIRVAAFDDMWDRIKQHVDSSQDIAFDAFVFGRCDLDQLITAHGHLAIFQSRSFSIYQGYARHDISAMMLDGQFGLYTRPDGDPIGTPEEFAVIGSNLFGSARPWDPGPTMHSGLQWRFKNGESTSDALEGFPLFGAFAAVAVLSERAAASGDGPELVSALEDWAGWVAALRPWLLTRLGSGADPLDSSSLPVDAQIAADIDAWANHEWSAVASRTRPKLKGIRSEAGAA